MNGSRSPYDDFSRGYDETERFGVDDGGSPWYLKRWVLVLWGLAVAILIAAILWGLAVLARGNGGSAPAPPTHTSTTTSHTSTTSSTTPSTTAPTTTTTTEETIEPTPSPSATWTPQHPRRHWWRSNLPPLPALPHF